jgi:hypothetical protein
MSAEGDAVQQMMPQDALMRLLQQQGVPMTPANMSRAAEGMISQEQLAPPRGSPVNDTPPSPSPRPAARRAAPTVQAAAQPNSRQQMEDASVSVAPAPTAPAASSAGMMDLLGPALTVALLGGGAYGASRWMSGSSAAPAMPTAAIVPEGGMPKSSMAVGPTSQVELPTGPVAPDAARTMQQNMPAESSVPKGPSSPLAPASDVATRVPKMVNPSPVVPKVGGSQLIEALLKALRR